MTIEDFFIQKNSVINRPHFGKPIKGKRRSYANLYMNNPKELPTVYAAQNAHVGRWTEKNRREHFYNLAKFLGVTQRFVTTLFKKEKELGKKVDVGTKIRNKAGLNRPKRKEPFNTATLTKRMNKIKTHRATCTANRTPLCLKVFVTNTEDTVCLRCQNYK